MSCSDLLIDLFEVLLRFVFLFVNDGFELIVVVGAGVSTVASDIVCRVFGTIPIEMVFVLSGTNRVSSFVCCSC